MAFVVFKSLFSSMFLSWAAYWPAIVIRVAWCVDENMANLLNIPMIPILAISVYPAIRLCKCLFAFCAMAIKLYFNGNDSGNGNNDSANVFCSGRKIDRVNVCACVSFWG